jgi:hypothetical protein
MRCGQGPRIFFRLTLGVEHQHVPCAIRAATAARIVGNVGGEQIVLAGDFLDTLQTTLLSFENEAVLFVKVNPAV